jgi:hypothetical protein
MKDFMISIRVTYPQDRWVSKETVLNLPLELLGVVDWSQIVKNLGQKLEVEVIAEAEAGAE